MKLTILTSLPFLIALGSCAAPPVITEAEALQQLSPEKWQVQNEIPMESTANVAVAADIKAYPVGRYVDAANPNVMHERHTIYRRETPETWRRDTNQGYGILLGPTVGLRNPVARKNPASQELTAELNRQKLVSGRLLSIEGDVQKADLRTSAILSQAEAIRAAQDTLLQRMNGYEKKQKALTNPVDSPLMVPDLQGLPKAADEPKPPIEPKPKN
jgi:hypothetical protein